MDGSSAPFLFLIECAGIVEQDAARRAIKVLKEVSVIEDGATAALFPDHGFSMSFEIDFENPLIRRQTFSLAFDAETFKTEISRARTFGLLDELDRLREAGFARGGSLDNAVVVGRDHVLNIGGLRYGDEFVRHKLLDAFGDLYLAGGPLIGPSADPLGTCAHTAVCSRRCSLTGGLVLRPRMRLVDRIGTGVARTNFAARRRLTWAPGLPLRCPIVL